MAKQTINIGAAPNDGTGTPLRTSFDYCNQNFTELYTATGPSGNNIVVPGSATITGDLTVDSSTFKVNSGNNNVGIGFAGNASSGRLQISQPLGSTIDGALRLTDDATTSFVFNNVSSGLSAIWSSGSIAFGVGSGTFAEAMRLNSTGLGVGGVPSYKLDVQGTSAGVLRLVNILNLSTDPAAVTRLSLDGQGATWHLDNERTNGIFKITRNSTACLTIDNSGNVGIGVTPSAWGSNSKALQVGSGSGAVSSTGAGSTSTRFTHGCYFDNTNWKYQFTSVGPSLYELTGANGGSTHAWYVSAGGTAGNNITFTQAMTLDASGRLLIGTATSGTAAGDGVVKLGTYGHCISQTGTSIASGSSVDLTVATGGVGYQGFLSVANTLDGNANSRTQTTYSVFGRGTSSTITQIATANGSTSGASFTVTTPSNGVIRITNTSGNVATISAQFFGGSSA